MQGAGGVVAGTGGQLLATARGHLLIHLPAPGVVYPVQGGLAQRLWLGCLLHKFGRHRAALKNVGQGNERGLYQAESAQQKIDRKSTRLNSSHVAISYAVFCLKKRNNRREHGRL